MWNLILYVFLGSVCFFSIYKVVNGLGGGFSFLKNNQACV